MTTFTREDFEHAARAGGIPIQGWFKTTSHDGTESLAVVTGREHAGPRQLGTMHVWCPPADDGDALRLAARLRLSTEWFGDHQVMVCPPGPPVGYVHEFTCEPDEGWRHAIFRAAIAIGRAMNAPEVRPNCVDAVAPPGVATPDHQLETLKTGSAS